MDTTQSTYYRDTAGATHKVVVVEVGKRMTLIQYFDNTRRGERWVHGRKYNHATRVRTYVYNHELRTN